MTILPISGSVLLQTVSAAGRPPRKSGYGWIVTANRSAAAPGSLCRRDKLSRLDVAFTVDRTRRRWAPSIERRSHCVASTNSSRSACVYITDNDDKKPFLFMLRVPRTIIHNTVHSERQHQWRQLNSCGGHSVTRNSIGCRCPVNERSIHCSWFLILRVATLSLSRNSVNTNRDDDNPAVGVIFGSRTARRASDGRSYGGDVAATALNGRRRRREQAGRRQTGPVPTRVAGVALLAGRDATEPDGSLLAAAVPSVVTTTSAAAAASHVAVRTTATAALPASLPVAAAAAASQRLSTSHRRWTNFSIARRTAAAISAYSSNFCCV